MNAPLVDRIVNAVLYEGYLLYPYRPSTKNVRRWNFGGLYPPHWCQQHDERFDTRAWCLLEGTKNASVHVEIRFLHLIERTAQRDRDAGAEIWQECVERRVTVSPCAMRALLAEPRRVAFAFPADAWHEPSSGEGGTIARRQESVAGSITVSAEWMAEGVYLLTVRIANETGPPSPAGAADNGEASRAQLQSLASAHAILQVSGGQFVSRIDPQPEYAHWTPPVKADELWPVLVGEEGRRDTLLCSPIILYDFPQVAPESPGDFFDATEIDELLTLRVMTLTDEEKREVARFDERGRELLERTQAMAQQQLAGLHGAMRSMRTLEEADDGP